MADFLQFLVLLQLVSTANFAIVTYDEYMEEKKVFQNSKVEKIFKGSLDSISSSSPSVKIQVMGGKVCLRRKGKTLLGIVNKLFVIKSLLTTPST